MIDCHGALANPTGFAGTSPTQTLPFTLGEAYVLSESFTAQAQANFFSQVASGELGLTYYLTDANGNPVNVFVTPEPRSLSLVVSGILLLSLLPVSRVALGEIRVCGRPRRNEAWA